MSRMAFAVAMLVVYCATPAHADTLPLIEGVPGTYTPGQAFTFQVQVPQLSNFSQYLADLIFGTTIPNPPLFVYSTPASPTPLGRYVFSSNAGYQSTESTFRDQTYVTLTFADSTGTAVTTQTGVNDTLATVTVIPEAGMTGPITISIGGDTTFSGQPTGGGSDPPPGTITIQQAGSAVPAPSGIALVGIGGLLLGVRSRLRKQAAI